MRPFTLTAIKTGISRLRTKGGARPDSLYDLVNGQFNAAREIIPRPGSFIYDVLGGSEGGGSHGLAFFRGKYHVFADHYFDLGSDTTMLHVLPHPDFDPAQPSAAPRLVEIHLAEPFLSVLFVVAEFDNGDVYYYWLTEGAEGGTEWEANHHYKISDMVRPTVPNGYYYRATRLNPAGTVWKAGELHEVGDIVEPTVYNGYEYEAIEVLGGDPRSGTVEPTWIAEDDAIVYEDVEGGGEPDDDQSGGNGGVPPDIEERYNRYGSVGGGLKGIFKDMF